MLFWKRIKRQIVYAGKAKRINRLSWCCIWNCLLGKQGCFRVVDEAPGNGAWFGQETDIEKETKVCGTNTVVVNEPIPKDTEPEVLSSPTERFYIIIGSYSSLEEAKKLVKDYIDEGFKKAIILSKDDKFRISLADYETKELADESKKELPEKYKDAWIMEF